MLAGNELNSCSSASFEISTTLILNYEHFLYQWVTRFLQMSLLSSQPPTWIFFFQGYEEAFFQPNVVGFSLLWFGFRTLWSTSSYYSHFWTRKLALCLVICLFLVSIYRCIINWKYIYDHGGDHWKVRIIVIYLMIAKS